MNLKLIRTNFSEFGIFSTFQDESDNDIAVCLEHAYRKAIDWTSWTYEPKLKPGIYKCVRGQHQLHSGPPFETFEITGVPGHSGVLFHVGNKNEDSEGCLLLGRRIVPNPNGPGDMITSSRNTFNKFMDLQLNINEFTLTVIGDI